MDNKDLENKKTIKNAYTKKAMNCLKYYMIFGAISILSYLIPWIFFSAFDFGIVFEFISLFFVYLAYNSLLAGNINLGKKDIIIAMIPIGWLIIYDFILLITNLGEVTRKCYLLLYEFFLAILLHHSIFS